ncbi:MAG: RagB/SusD family nutrient uptake outer membrane protein [Bacteroidales bacterium]|nr:RagB/SusD family nutrient uptake outer membrane protein [Bacteroidales bacterium]
MKIRNIITAFAGIAVIASCSLDEYPYGFYSEDNFYQTAADAEAAVNYIYDAITYIEYSRAIVFLGDMNTDALSPKGDAAAATKELDTWNLNNLRTNTTLGNFYKYSYITINRANAVIAKVPGMTSLDESYKNRYIGEAYFMRGYSYFCLARNFGCVPIHLTPVTTIEDTTVPAAESLDELWGIIINDFKKAAELLPLYGTPITGRTDQAAAYGMLAKAYLYIASAKDHGAPQYSNMSHDVDDYYAKAVEAAAKVVDNAEQTTYGFDENLLDIYDVSKPTGPEHLFLMSMDVTGETEGQYSKISKMYIPYISGATIYIKQGDTDEYIASHDGWSEYRTTDELYDSFETGDRRHDWLIVDKVYDADGNVVASVDDGKLTYPFCRKFIDPNFSGDKTSTKPFLLRYSDVALVYAEAAGPTDKAYELVNYIRNRAGLANLATGLSTDEFREAVLKERSYELAFEGDKCYDLRRWNKLHTEITAAREQGYTAEDLVFYPIPSLETDLNPNL